MLDNINTGYYGTKGSGKMARIDGSNCDTPDII